MLSPREVVYTGIFLDEASQKLLLEKVPALHKNIFAHHITVKYRPTCADLFAYELGKEYDLEISEVSKDAQGQAVILKNIKTENPVSHITISTAGETKPNYSNELIKNVPVEPVEPFTIKGKYGFFCSDDKYVYEFPQFDIHTIQLPTRPQPDTLIAVFILKKYASSIFKNLDTAKVECNPIFSKGETFESLLAKGILAIDFEQSQFDHHNNNASSAVQSILAWGNLEKNKELQKLAEFAKRSEEGKGTISQDALDKMFGLDGLIMTLNRVHEKDPKKVFDIVDPILAAHHTDIYEKVVVTPALWETLLATGKAKMIKCQTNIGQSKIALVESDSQTLPGFVRSYQGEKCDLFIQKLSSGHVNVLSKANNNIDLSKLAGIIRQAESLMRKRPLRAENLREAGRIEEIPEWYYDKVTNSLLNGGRNAGDVEATKIPWHCFETLVKKSFE